MSATYVLSFEDSDQSTEKVREIWLLLHEIILGSKYLDAVALPDDQERFTLDRLETIAPRLRNDFPRLFLMLTSQALPDTHNRCDCWDMSDVPDGNFGTVSQWSIIWLRLSGSASLIESIFRNGDQVVILAPDENDIQTDCVHLMDWLIKLFEPKTNQLVFSDR